MRYKVGIIDNDIEYMQSIMEYINANNYPIRMVGFSSLSATEEYIVDNRLDVLLLNNELTDNKVDVPIIYLTGNKTYIDNAGYIYKYQNMDIIVDCVVRYIREQRIAYDKKHTHLMYAIYSPLGRCGKTNLARGICSYYKDSLYVGFEEYCSMDNLPEGKCKMAEEFLYYMMSRNSKILDVVGSDNEIVGNLNYQDIKQLSRSDIEWFKEVFGQQDRVFRIIFDIGVGALNDISILSAMDKIYIPILKDKTSVNKINQFKRMLKEDIYRQIEKNINYIMVPDVDYDDEKIKALIEGGQI